MTVARRKGNPGKADRLFSLIVRSRGRCEYPGCDSRGPFDTAHLIGRTYSATRCHEDNAISACRTHHQLIDAWWDEKQRVIEATIGMDRYWELKALAREGLSTTSARFWTDEAQRLTARCAELDIDTRRSA